MLTKCVIQRKKNGEILISSTCEYGRGTLRILSSLTTPTDLNTHTHTLYLSMASFYGRENSSQHTPSFS